jgi:2-polyprenyl-3-methyl-5-hydroxy-6-metoxy-1,4-benzoquinol methylase
MSKIAEPPHCSTGTNNRSPAWQSDGGGCEVVCRCPLCGADKPRLLFEAVDTLHGFPGTWGIFKCGACGLMVTSPRPNREAIADYYPDDYQPFTAPHAPRTVGWTRALKPLVARLLDSKEHILPPHIRGGTALEVGCGSGRFLIQLAEMGWQVRAIDPSVRTIDALRKCTGLPIQVGTIESTRFDSSSFDLIAALMVLEHLHDPLEDACKLHDWLRPGGYLMGSVPNCASWEFRYFNAEWYALQAPTHLFHFTPVTLRRLLENAGFSKVQIFQQRNVNNLMVHLGRFLEGRRLPGAKTCLEYPERGSTALRYTVRPAASMLAWLHQAGRMSFLARKSDNHV